MSLSHLLLIAIVALVLFGPNKLPELGRAIGRTMREFKKGAQDLMDDIQAEPQAERKDVTPQPDPVSGLQFPPTAPSQSSQNTESSANAQHAPSAQGSQNASPSTQTVQPLQSDEQDNVNKPAAADRQSLQAEPTQESPSVQPGPDGHASQQNGQPQEAKPSRQSRPADTRRLPD